MKVTLAFDLPDEKYDLMTALCADDYVSCLIDIDNSLRNTLKYGAQGKTYKQKLECVLSLLEELRASIRSRHGRLLEGINGRV